MNQSGYPVVFIICLFYSLALFSAEPDTVNQRLGRGINLGNALEAPSEGEWGVVLEEEYFEIIRSLGFNSVRVPVRWSTRSLEEGPYTINEDFFERVDWVINNALGNGLLAIINFHHYDSLYEYPLEEEERFLSMWGQVASRYSDYPDSLVFEILNEPHGNLTSDLWNNILSEALNVIREDNPDRAVIIGTAGWGGSGGLSSLELPDDDNLVLTVHWYNPFEFTHQGAGWVEGADEWLGTTWEGDYYQKTSIVYEIESISRFSEENSIPVNMGEFGAYSAADMDSRALWTEFMARLFEENGFSWHYWEFCSGFGIYNPDAGTLYTPLCEALISEDTTILDPGNPGHTTGDNIIRDPFFLSGMDEWLFGAWDTGSEAEEMAGDSLFAAHITAPGTEQWHIQLIQSPLSLEGGTEYLLSFSARSEGLNTISVSVDGGGSLGGVPLENTFRTFNVKIEPTQDMDSTRLVFNFGANDTGTVYLKDLSLKRIDDSSPIIHKHVNEINSNSAPLSLTTRDNSIILNSERPSGDILLEIYDLKGRVLFTKKLANVSSLKERISIPADIRHGGSFIFRVSTGRVEIFRGKFLMF